MRYEYSGYLKSFLRAPNAAERDGLDQIVFTADELAQWQLSDEETEKEWQHIPARREKTETGVLIQGNFEEVRLIDNLQPDDPSFWVALSSRFSNEPRIPVDLDRYPVIEITYRCHTANARPSWVGHYPGGRQFDGLQPTREWRTIARLVQHYGFPRQFTQLTFRLYSTARSTESFEIREVRFRAMSEAERSGCESHESLLQSAGPPKHYPLLDEFMPLGVFMKAGSAKRLANMMEIPFRDYWRLALEDVARHHHNTIGLEEINQLSESEYRELLSLAETFGIRVLAIHHWALDGFARFGREIVDKQIRPYADSPAILGWMLAGEPPDSSFDVHLQARVLIEEADPNHPLAVVMRDPNAFSRFGPYFAALGLCHFKSRSAWDMRDIVKTHYPLCRGQQLWVAAPAFVYATETPEWYTCPEMRMMINLAFSSGARGWLSFAYHNDPVWTGGACERSLTGPFLTFSDLWSEVGHRMERFSGMAPLFLNARPIEAPGETPEIAWQTHPRSRLPEGVSPIRTYWLEGEDFRLLYLISSDINEVTPVNLHVTDATLDGLEVFDVTDFVRSRTWSTMERHRHLEMFPGQGHVLLMAEPQAAERWRRRIVERLVENDRKQVALDLSLARRYDLDISEVQQLVQNIGIGSELEDLKRMQSARDQLLNMIYDAPTIIGPRSRIIQASAIVCACDGALCRLMNMGKVDLARELGLKIPPLTREMTQLRLKLRRGRGIEISKQCDELVHRALKILADIRAVF